MKTLKQQLQEAETQFAFENPDEDTPYVEITLKAVKEWLTQKRQELLEDKPTIWKKTTDPLTVANYIQYELLEEINQ